jgi:hypothetical protein
MALVKSKEGPTMVCFSGKSTLELRNLQNDAWKREGLYIEMDDCITAIQASTDGLYLLVNISMQKPRIELLSFNGE